MNATTLLDACRAAGVMLQIDGENLVVETDRDPPPDLIAELREHKRELIAVLSPQVAADVVNDLDERAAIIEYGAGVPRVWAEGYAALASMPAPTGFSPKRWQRIIDATGTFLDRWAAEAIECGWSDLDVFGCNPDRPDARFDCMGLVLLLDRCEVVSIDKGGADLVTATGARQRYRRRPLPSDTVSLWQLVQL
jgi:hypothetical protein